MLTAFLVVAAFELGSCAARTENLLLPVAAPAPGVTSVDILVATTRRPVDNPGEVYSSEWSGPLGADRSRLSN
jgi:esterase/lipase superfamily enzyme